MLGLNYSEQRGAFISRDDHAGFYPQPAYKLLGVGVAIGVVGVFLPTEPGLQKRADTHTQILRC